MWITRAVLFQILTPLMEAHIEVMSSTQDLFGFRIGLLYVNLQYGVDHQGCPFKSSRPLWKPTLKGCQALKACLASEWLILNEIYNMMFG